MSPNVDGLFRIEKIRGGYAVMEYLKKDDPGITELEFPEEFNGERVTAISGLFQAKYIKQVVVPPSVRHIDTLCFSSCKSLEAAELSEGLETIGSLAFEKTNLKSVKLPKSLNQLGNMAFTNCDDLQSVIFSSAPKIGMNVFNGCPKLPPETVAIGVLCSTDITTPVSDYNNYFRMKLCVPKGRFDGFRPDVFELLAKNNCFRYYNLRRLIDLMINENIPELIPIAGQYGMLEDAGILDMLLSYTIENHNTEITAYLLDLKNRKFGFNGGDDLEL